MESDMSKVYILVDQDDFIIRIEGGYTLPVDLEGWIFIDEGYGDKYNLAQTHYLPKSIMKENGDWQYKYINGEIVEVE